MHRASDALRVDLRPTYGPIAERENTITEVITADLWVAGLSTSSVWGTSWLPDLAARESSRFCCVSARARSRLGLHAPSSRSGGRVALYLAASVVLLVLAAGIAAV